MLASRMLLQTEPTHMVASLAFVRILMVTAFAVVFWASLVLALGGRSSCFPFPPPFVGGTEQHPKQF